VTAATDYLLIRRRDRVFLAMYAVVKVLGLAFLVLLVVARPDVFPIQVAVPIALAFVLPLCLIVAVKRRRVMPAERVARSLGIAFVVAPTPGLSDLLARFSPSGTPPQRHFPIEMDDAGLHFLPEHGGAPFATIPWASVERIDGGDALRIVLDEDTNVLLQPMGRVFALGRRRVRALAERLRRVAG
jgi:hypothetical protein